MNICRCIKKSIAVQLVNLVSVLCWCISIISLWPQQYLSDCQCVHCPVSIVVMPIFVMFENVHCARAHLWVNSKKSVYVGTRAHGACTAKFSFSKILQMKYFYWKFAENLLFTKRTNHKKKVWNKKKLHFFRAKKWANCFLTWSKEKKNIVWVSLKF